MNDKPNKQHEQRLIVVLVLLLLALCAANLWFGSVQIPASAVWDILCGKEPEKEVWKFIVLESRLPQMAAALLSGAALAVAGLLLQTGIQQPARRTFDIRNRYGSQFRSGFGHVILGRDTRRVRGNHPHRIHRHHCRSFSRFCHGVRYNTLFLDHCQEQHHAPHRRYNGRLYYFVGYLSTQLFRNGRRGTLLYDLGYGKFQRSHRASSCPISHFSYLSDLSSQYF